MKSGPDRGLYGDEEVTPFTGVWIEIPVGAVRVGVGPVTPFTGVWIEMQMDEGLDEPADRHTLHGCVD